MAHHIQLPGCAVVLSGKVPFFFNCDFGAGDQQEMPMECDKSLPAESVFAVAPVQNVGSVRPPVPSLM